MAPPRVARAAYRAPVRVARALERERVRARAKTALELCTERELSTLEGALGARAMRRARTRGGATTTTDVVRDAFRARASGEDDDARVDAAALAASFGDDGGAEAIDGRDVADVLARRAREEEDEDIPPGAPAGDLDAYLNDLLGESSDEDEDDDAKDAATEL